VADVWIIYDNERYSINSAFADKLITAFKTRGITAQLVMDYDCATRLDTSKAAIMRTADYMLSQRLELKGIRVFNDSNVSKIANDKWQTYLLMKEKGIPYMPCSLISLSDIDNLNSTFPKVVKSRGGHGGSEVFMAENKSDVINAFNATRADTLILQDVASVLGRDLRAYVLGGKIVACMLRESDVDFRSNFSLGGSAKVHIPDPLETDLILRASLALPADYVGIDLIYNNGAPVLNEIEDIVGSRMLYQYTDIDIADMFVKYIAEKTF
jgi:RimK family alpha-L-glutamate ligase